MIHSDYVLSNGTALPKIWEFNAWSFDLSRFRYDIAQSFQMLTFVPRHTD